MAKEPREVEITEFKYTNAVYILCENGTVYERSTGEYVPIKIDSKGYKTVRLTCEDPKTSKRFTLHRLLAQHFIPKTPSDIRHERIYVHFKDYDHQNVSLDNLEWVNRIELQIKNNIRDNKPATKEDYYPYICMLIADNTAYDKKEICEVLGLSKFKFYPIIKKIMQGKLVPELYEKYSNK